MPWFGKYWTRRELWREVDRLRAELALARQGGGAVNAAARLCGLAQAGEVLVGQTTRSTMAGADQGLVWTERQVDLKGLGRLTAFQVAKGR